MFFKNKTLKRTFTLIELLVVIVTIGILAAALIPQLQRVQGRARDAVRKKDVGVIADALQLHYADNGYYPESRGIMMRGREISYQTTWLEPLVTGGYLSVVPRDPLNRIIETSARFQGFFYAYHLYRKNAVLGGVPGVFQCPTLTADRYAVLGATSFEVLTTEPIGASCPPDANGVGGRDWVSMGDEFDYTYPILYKGSTVQPVTGQVAP